MESHRAFNNSLITVVSGNESINKRDKKKTSRKRNKEESIDYESNIQGLREESGAGDDKDYDESIKTYVSSEEDNGYRSYKQKRIEKRSKGQELNDTIEERNNEKEGLPSKNEKKMQIKAVGRSKVKTIKNSYRESLDSETDIVEGRSSFSVDSMDAENSVLSKSIMSQHDNRKDSKSTSAHDLDNSTDEVSDKKVKQNINLARKNVTQRRKSESTERTPKKSDSVSSEILNGYNHCNTSSDYFKAISGQIKGKDYVNILESYDEKDVEEVYNINQKIYSKMTEYLSKNLRP